MTPNQKARALAITLTSIWDAYSDENSDDRDNAIRLAFEAVRAMNLDYVCGTMASPLKYFATAYLDDHNPEDLTYDEMMGALTVSLSLTQSEG